MDGKRENELPSIQKSPGWTGSGVGGAPMKLRDRKVRPLNLWRPTCAKPRK